ncbi:hypothetical protein BJ742DRAFT_813209 [Cladochytrium replicatum]|nr:hypothetical protein BJ742DRAFT_813209 [Cladochytrium replicatum]
MSNDPRCLSQNLEMGDINHNRQSRCFVFYAFGSRGDVMPCIVLGSNLRRLGHRVRVATVNRWKPLLKRLQLEHVNCIDDLLLDTDEGYPASSAKLIADNAGTLAGVQHVMDAFKPLVSLLIRTVKDICGPFNEPANTVDLVFLSNAALALSDYLELNAIPYGYILQQPSHRTCEYGAPLTGIGFDPDAKTLNKLSWYAQEFMTANLFREPLETHRRDILGLRSNFLPFQLTAPADILRGIMDHRRQFRQVLTITNFSEALLPVPMDIGTKRSKYFLQTGPFVLNEEWEPPTSLTDWLENGPKPIYFGYGSLQSLGKPSSADHSSKEEEHIIAWINVINRINASRSTRGSSTAARAIFNFSWKQHGCSSAGPRAKGFELLEKAVIAKTVYVIDGPVPHTWLFPRCSITVHHGGAGTTQTACLAGIPSVVIPHISDQWFMATLLNFKGVAPPPFPLENFDEDSLFSAISTVLEDSRFTKSAERIARLMKVEEESSVKRAIDIISMYLGESEHRAWQ